MNTHSQIFVSYVQPNAVQARALAKFLQSAGLKTWLDKENLAAGEDWELVIRREIDKSALVLICLSAQAANRKGYFHKEMKLATEVAQRLPQGKIYIVPVRLADCEIPPALQQIHVINLFEPDASRRLLESIGKALNEDARTTDDEHRKLADVLENGNAGVQSKPGVFARELSEDEWVPANDGFSIKIPYTEHRTLEPVVRIRVWQDNGWQDCIIDVHVSEQHDVEVHSLSRFRCKVIIK
jgi:hypothetical protein